MEENINNHINVESIIDVDNLVNNSIILFRVKEYNDLIAKTIAALHQIYGKQFKEKNISFLVLKTGTDISILKPQEMEKLGWIKKDKSLIIH
jgi:hypothetical protein